MGTETGAAAPIRDGRFVSVGGASLVRPQVDMREGIRRLMAWREGH